MVDVKIDKALHVFAEEIKYLEAGWNFKKKGSNKRFNGVKYAKENMRPDYS